ncbi:signal peptidase II [Bifidobacterium polysaccharolyticum]|uniref:Lipoprotein signal peptidase n=1 Tax=Bifidobacterium polysaccharolyticum TaxID=2750967 RepID=A0ABS0QTB5_9BIFI|nr:signal peptidase II [Bifidobacterium polysaccharolyticum]MBI0105133.1 signal peptidase II [Bifidobacterium polysaccharolyticum]
MRRLRGRVAVFVALAAVSIALDQLTKALALARLGNGIRVALPGPLRGLRLVRNPGASLGLGSGSTWVISLIALAACLLIIVLALRTTSMVWTVVLSMAFSGAAGNLIDRVSYASGFLDGAVVDFLDYGWSVGNVADVYLTLAGAAVVVLIICNVRFIDRSKTLKHGGAAK